MCALSTMVTCNKLNVERKIYHLIARSGSTGAPVKGSSRCTPYLTCQWKKPIVPKYTYKSFLPSGLW